MCPDGPQEKAPWSDRGAVGQLISMMDRVGQSRATATAPGAGAPRGRRDGAAFFFALDCPLSYLVAEQVERDLGEIAWVPILAGRDPRWASERLHQSRALAMTQRLPLIEPENFPFDIRPVSRAALYAAEQGAGRRFALAAFRLTFAGGYDLSHPELIAAAGEAAGLRADATLKASASSARDATLRHGAASLRRRGIHEAPVLRIIAGWFSAFEALSETSAFTVARTAYAATALSGA
jgi:2-hydroxychromene-2-carboxylate isomerase